MLTYLSDRKQIIYDVNLNKSRVVFIFIFIFLNHFSPLKEEAMATTKK